MKADTGNELEATERERICINCHFSRGYSMYTPSGRWCDFAGRPILQTAGCESWWPGWVFVDRPDGKGKCYGDPPGFITYREATTARDPNAEERNRAWHAADHAERRMRECEGRPYP